MKRSVTAIRREVQRKLRNRVGPERDFGPIRQPGVERLTAGPAYAE